MANHRSTGVTSLYPLDFVQFRADNPRLLRGTVRFLESAVSELTPSVALNICNPNKCIEEGKNELTEAGFEVLDDVAHMVVAIYELHTESFDSVEPSSKRGRYDAFRKAVNFARNRSQKVESLE